MLKRLVFAAVTSMAVAAAAAAETWNMPTPYAESNFHTRNVHKFAADLAAAADGRFNIVVHSAASLFKLPEIKRAVQTGQVPIGEILMSALGNEDPMYEVDSVPFLASDYESAWRLWEISRPYIEARLDRQGIMLLYAVPWPPQAFFTRRELRTIDDLRGMRFRVYNAATSRFAELMGTIPTTVQMPELPHAFTTGLVDAMVTSPTFAVDVQAWDFVTYYYAFQTWLPKNIVIVNKRSFQRLDPTSQQALLDAAAAAEARGWQMSRDETEERNRMLADKGLALISPDPELAAALTPIGDVMIEEWIARAGSEGAELIETFQNSQ